MSKLSLALIAALPTLACVDTSSTPPSTPETSEDVISALEQENGGFDTEDEVPLFGAETLYANASIEADAPVADPLASDPGMLEMQGLPTAVARDLVILWGRMPVDPTATAVRDWSGSLQVSRGGMLVRRQIAFEDLGDRLLPRTDRAIVAFESHTRPHADGLVLTVVDPTPGAGPITLSYASADGAASHAIDLSNLANGPIVVDAGDGNRILIAGRRHDDACAHGTMRGRWRALTANAGVYLGVVANGMGLPIGHVRGIWGKRQTGEQVFFGKYIDRDGRFQGILAGTHENGQFAGRWLDRDGDRGLLRGVYFDAPSLPGGVFLARWGETSCAN